MHFTQARALSGEFAFWWTVSLAAAAGVLSVPLLNRPQVAHLLMLVPVWLFGAWFSLGCFWLPRDGVILTNFGLVLYLFLYFGGLVAAYLVLAVWDWARRRGGYSNL
jgi:hypothetical protein